MTEGRAEVIDRTRKVKAKVRLSCALLLTTDILMHAADEGVGTVQRQARQQLIGMQGHTSRIQQLQKCQSLLEINSSQRDAALCSAALAQSGTDVMVSLIP